MPKRKVRPAAEWPADTVERRPVKDLVPYARNSRTHTDEQVQQLAASIEQFGFTKPVLIDEDNTIIAGHARVMAVEHLGCADVPVMVARGWTEAQRRAYVIADNALALNAGWDEGVLADELHDIAALEFDLDPIGLDTLLPDEADDTDAFEPVDEVASLDEVTGAERCDQCGRLLKP